MIGRKFQIKDSAGEWISGGVLAQVNNEYYLIRMSNWDIDQIVGVDWLRKTCVFDSKMHEFYDSHDAKK